MQELTFHGTPREMGLAHGQALRHLIPVGIEMCCRFHRPEHTARLKELTRVYLDRHAAAFPHLVEELRAVADGAGVPLEDLAAMSLRAYNNVTAEFPEMAEDCYSLAVTESDRGPLQGGALECVPWMYVVARMRPTSGYAFIHTPWAGTQWGVRGMNEHGLSIGQASIRRGPHTRPEARKLPVHRPLVLCYWVFRECLQRCRTTAEAIEFIAGYDFASNVVLADATGDIAAVEAVPGHKVVRRPGALGAVACASAFASEEMIQALEGAGFDHRAQPLYRTAIVRHQRLEAMAAAARGRFTLDWLAALLRNHDGEPGTELCHQGNVCSTIAVASERRFCVAARYPCRNEFVAYDV
jgi:hypothetical protein